MKKFLRKVKLFLRIATTTEKAIEGVIYNVKAKTLTALTAWAEIKPVLISIKEAVGEKGDEAIDKIIEAVDKALELNE